MAEPITLYINKGTNRLARTLEELNETNDLTIGQSFLAVSTHYGKCRDDYPRWISYEKNKSEFLIIKGHIDELATDLEKINLVCDWLGEEPIC